MNVAAKASSAASVFEEENELPVAGYNALLLPEALNADNTCFGVSATDFSLC